MSIYKIVKSTNYTKEHTNYINEFKIAINSLAAHTNVMLFLTDTQQKFITGTDLAAATFGLKSGKDFNGKTFLDLPCPGIAPYAKDITQHEIDLINNLDINKTIDVLNIFEFSDGLKARIANKRIFYHEPSHSILGVVTCMSNIEPKQFMHVIPDFLLRFISIRSIENIQESIPLNGAILNEYEEEICFLLLLNWSFTQIANFMDTFRPYKAKRSADAIIKKKNYICAKLYLRSTNVKHLCDYLFSIGFHNKIPKNFYLKMLGTKVL